MVATVKQKTVYKCEVCNKTHATLKAAEKCENSHEETRIKLEKEAAERMKLHDTLVGIRLTSESFTELNERALKALQEHYGDDFVLDINFNTWDTRAKCTYVLNYKLNTKDYFSDGWSARNGVDASRILQTLGLKTGCGSGDGKIYHYQSSYSISDFPMIQQKMQERETAVMDCEDEIVKLADTTMRSMFDSEVYQAYSKSESDMEKAIEDLRLKLSNISAHKQQFIKDYFYNEYEAKVHDMIAALPQQFKDKYRDPLPSTYYNLD